MMEHPIYRVVAVKILGGYTLQIEFDDHTSQVINFRPILEGELYGALQDPALFNQARIDPEVHTIVWPNGADFDPATLHDWPIHEKEFKALAKQWAAV